MQTDEVSAAVPAPARSGRARWWIAVLALGMVPVVTGVLSRSGHDTHTSPFLLRAEKTVGSGTTSGGRWEAITAPWSDNACLRIRVFDARGTESGSSICRSSLTGGAAIGGFNFTDALGEFVMEGVVDPRIVRVVIHLTAGAPIDLVPWPLGTSAFYFTPLSAGARFDSIAVYDEHGDAVQTLTCARPSGPGATGGCTAGPAHFSRLPDR